MELFQTVYEVPNGYDGTCEVCGAEAFAVGLVGIIEAPEAPIELYGFAGVIKNGPDRPFLVVGPCGHSTLDAGGGFVYRMSEKVG